MRTEEILLNTMRNAIFQQSENANYTNYEVDEAVYALAKAHTVTPLLFGTSFSSDALKQKVQSDAKQNALQCYRFLFRTKFFVRLLAENDIPVVVLKGVSAARYYPVPEYRKSGDIDLLLLNPTQSEKAVSLLQKNGCFLSEDEQNENHQIVLRDKDGIAIELHVLLVEPFDAAETNAVLENLAREIPRHIEHVDIFGVPFPVLSDGYQAAALMLHALQHFLRAGFGLKLLVDFAALFSHSLSKEETEHFVRIVNDFRITGFAETVLSSCVYFLGLPEKQNPLRLCDRALCDRFLSDLLSAEEFGHSEASRMVALRGTGLGDYLREFHHQTVLQNPALSKKKLFLPVLYTRTLAKFLRNNLTGRKTSAISVFVSAKERGALSYDMEIFRR